MEAQKSSVEKGKPFSWLERQRGGEGAGGDQTAKGVGQSAQMRLPKSSSRSPAPRSPSGPSSSQTSALILLPPRPRQLIYDPLFWPTSPACCHGLDVKCLPWAHGFRGWYDLGHVWDILDMGSSWRTSGHRGRL